MCYGSGCSNERYDGECKLARPTHSDCVAGGGENQEYTCEECGHVVFDGTEPEQCPVCGSEEIYAD